MQVLQRRQNFARIEGGPLLSVHLRDNIPVFLDDLV